MSTTPPAAFSRQLTAYVSVVVLLGLLVILDSFGQLLAQVPEYKAQWLWLVALTVVSGLLPVRLATVHATISVSETFVIAGTLLFGRAGGTALVLLDAVFISIFLLFSKKIRWQQIPFNLSASPLSIWLAATLASIEPMFGTGQGFSTTSIIQLAIFCTLYFLFNTGLITFAISLQSGVSPRQIWWTHFREILFNYIAGGSIAALLVYNTREVRPEFVVAILPLLLVMFLTYRWSNRRIEIERERNADLNRVFLSTIEALALAIDAKDQVTHGHIRRVQRYTLALARAVGVTNDKELDAIRAAALLHDTGKLAVPEYILNKPGPLTASEFERMKVHADVGADILKSIDFPYPVEPIVRHHHEQWDGSGYPAGLKGQEIPLGARILSVVDCYDALTSDRPYRPRMSRAQAENILKDRKGAAYDPWIVDEFIRLLDRLEEADAAEERGLTSEYGPPPALAPEQLNVIAATTAEEREFSELRRELARAPSVTVATDILFRHTKRVMPAVTLAFYVPRKGTDELGVVAAFGVGAEALLDLRVTIGERISGWAFAHTQGVINSDAALELGPVAKTYQVPLRYVAAALVGEGAVKGVVLVFSSEPLVRDQLRLLENSTALFSSSVPEFSSDNSSKPSPRQPTAQPSVVH
jgi:putative nucleotidyltransferase with HDIG domain